MKSYLFDLFILSLVFGLLLQLSPEGYKKIISSALCLILATSLLSPLSSLIGDLDKIEPPEFSEEEGEGAYIEVARSAFEEGVRSFLSSEFSVSRDCIEVEAVGFDFSTMTAERLIVTLTGRAAFLDTKKVKARLEQHSVGVVEVKIEI